MVLYAFELELRFPPFISVCYPRNRPPGFVGLYLTSRKAQATRCVCTFFRMCFVSDNECRITIEARGTVYPPKCIHIPARADRALRKADDPMSGPNFLVDFMDYVGIHKVCTMLHHRHMSFCLTLLSLLTGVRRSNECWRNSRIGFRRPISWLGRKQVRLFCALNQRSSVSFWLWVSVVIPTW